MSHPFVVVSQNVFTAAAATAEPLALLIKDSRIERTFSPHDITHEAPGVKVVDYGDAFITPGLHDAHMHVLHAALFPSALATEYAGSSEADCVAHMQAFAQTRPQDSSWLLSHGWRETLWDNPRMPSRASLDQAFPHRPVAMYSGDAHTLWVNSCGLERLGLTSNIQDPAGGAYERDEHGELTGILQESAAMMAVAQVVSSFSQQELVDIYRNFFAKLSTWGVTSVCDMALSTLPGADCINPEVYENLLAQGDLPVRAHLFPCLGDSHELLASLQARLSGSMLRAPGFKQFFDGVSSQHTAWCTEPYENARFAGDVGRPTIAPERMRELALTAAAAGYAVRIHTIGDAAVHEAINIFEEAQARYGRPKQGAHTIEHVEDIQSKDIQRMAALGLVASVQPPHVTIDVTQPARDLGEWRAARMWPFASFVAQQVPLSFGTDAPVVDADPTKVLYCAVTRQLPQTGEPAGGWYPEQRISMSHALQAYTAGSAAAVGRQDELGTLEAGKLADFVVWDTNLLSCTPQDVLRAHCVASYVDGQLTYTRA